MVKFTFLALLCALCPILAQAEVTASKKPIIYLTFDDGPSGDNVTGHILDILDEYDAKATFFVTGLRARANPEKVVEIVAAGHALGNHTLSHSRLTSLPDHKIVEELSETNRYVYDAGGPLLSCFRAPFGATDDRVKSIAQRMGLRAAGWTIDTRDWDPNTRPENIEIQLDDSHDGSVVLLHDGPSSRWKTLAVFSKWMQETGRFYDFRALPDCVKPFNQTFAALDAVPALPVVTPSRSTKRPEVKAKALLATNAVDVEVTKDTIAGLIKKLRNYRLTLQPEVVAQNDIRSTTF